MYGLLGKKLGHSFSKKVHEHFTKKEYTLIETDNLDRFFNSSNHIGLNVTIPYKTSVIPYLDELSTEAKALNAVNTIFFKSGKRIGFNTDYYGLKKSLEINDISVTNKHVIIMGNGSTSRTIQYYCKQNNVKKITILARNPKENEYHFNDVDNFTSAQIIFNATPVGMFPHSNQRQLIQLDKLTELDSVIDLIYNPLRSNLLIAAENRGLKTVNGLLMLLYQAVKSIEIFHNITFSDQEVLSYYQNLTLQMKNFVFIGMPMSGKSYLAKLISKKLNKDLFDTDQAIEEYVNDSIENIFKYQGEKFFRKVENKIIIEVSKQHNKAISCGGGVILRKDNMTHLKQNGIIIFIDASLTLLKRCNPKGRPLLQKASNLERLYNQRYPIYTKYADVIIQKDHFLEREILHQIEVKINEYINT
jgi:shikimate dehydrogenase